MSLFFGKKQKTAEAEKVDFNNLPRHIAIILDGNGRWAQKRGLPRTAGHAAGAETFRKIATYCKEIGLEYLTVYAFSTENWKRPQQEVDTIMSLLEKYLYEAIDQMEKDRVKMAFFGDTTVLSPKLQELIARTRDISKHYEGCQVNICLNYGGRDEILRGIRKYAEEYKNGVRVHMISPGGVFTDMVKISRPDLTGEGMIQPEDIADIAVFLLTHRTNAVIDEICVHRLGKEPFL